MFLESMAKPSMLKDGLYKYVGSEIRITGPATENARQW